VLTASDAETGMTIALQEEPDLILLDIPHARRRWVSILPPAESRSGDPRNPGVFS